MLNFKPMSECPVAEPYNVLQLLFRFKHKQAGWIYFTGWSSGPLTKVPGYANPEEWSYIPDA